MSAALDDRISVELIDEQPHVFWWRRFPYLVEGQPPRVLPPTPAGVDRPYRQPPLA